MKSSSLIISASVLSADFREFEKQLKIAEQGGIDWIHVDVMDGVFVPNISMGSWIVEICHNISALPIDVHLMITQPERYIDSFQKAGANNISVHVEAHPNINRTLQSIHSSGCKAGVVLNPGTPLSCIEEVLCDADMVLVMSVNPGFSGQKFLPNMIDKITRLAELIGERNLNTMIQVDGGISSETLPLVYKAGARNIVAGNAIFKHPNGILAGINSLRNSQP